MLINTFRLTPVLLFLCGTVTSCATIKGQEGAFAQVFGEGTTNISFNRGGNPKLFISAAKEVRETKRMIKISGPCASACTVFADQARPHVCITNRAVFLFHKGTSTLAYVITVKYGKHGEHEFSVPFQMEESWDPSMSPDIETWVLERGGFPSEGLLEMNANEASQFWPLCR